MVQILSLGQTLGFSHKLQHYVQCFAGLDLEDNSIMRLLGEDRCLPSGAVFEMEIGRDKTDSRSESYRLKSEPKPIDEESNEQIIERLKPIAFDCFEDAIESEQSMAAVFVRSFDFTFARDFKSSIDLIDNLGDRMILRYLARDAQIKSLPRSWQSKGKPAIVIIGNKKINRDWIAIRMFGAEFAKPFDRREYQAQLMRDRRAVK